MITPRIVDEVKNRLVQAYSPIAIYLFGSYARGNPDDQSDLDLLIIVESSDIPPLKRAIKAYEALMDINIPSDVIIYTKDEFEQRSQDVTTMSYKIKHEGKLIYGKS